METKERRKEGGNQTSFTRDQGNGDGYKRKMKEKGEGSTTVSSKRRAEHLLEGNGRGERRGIVEIRGYGKVRGDVVMRKHLLGREKVAERVGWQGCQRGLGQSGFCVQGFHLCDREATGGLDLRSSRGSERDEGGRRGRKEGNGVGGGTSWDQSGHCPSCLVFECEIATKLDHETDRGMVATKGSKMKGCLTEVVLGFSVGPVCKDRATFFRQKPLDDFVPSVLRGKVKRGVSVVVADER